MDSELPVEPKNKLAKQVAAIVSATLVIVFSTGMFYGDTKSVQQELKENQIEQNIRITKVEEKYTTIAVTQAITPEQIKSVIDKMMEMDKRMDRQDTIIKDDQKHINVIMNILLDDYKQRTGREYVPNK